MIRICRKKTNELGENIAKGLGKMLNVIAFIIDGFWPFIAVGGIYYVATNSFFDMPVVILVVVSFLFGLIRLTSWELWHDDDYDYDCHAWKIINRKLKLFGWDETC